MNGIFQLSFCFINSVSSLLEWECWKWSCFSLSSNSSSQCVDCEIERNVPQGLLLLYFMVEKFLWNLVIVQLNLISINFICISPNHNIHYLKTRAVKVSALIYAINVVAINAIKYFNAVNATLFTSGVRCPLTCANVASPLHRRHGASSLICNFIKVNTNMSHFLFLTLTLQQPPCLLHPPSSFTADPPTNQPMRACYPTQPHPIGLELSHVPPRPVHWPSGHLSTYLITL